jgi:hypothetical protein
MEHDSKLCLACARAKMANRPTRPCADCVLLNTDAFAKIRANAAKPSPLARFSFSMSSATAYTATGAATPSFRTPSRGGRSE